MKDPEIRACAVQLALTAYLYKNRDRENWTTEDPIDAAMREAEKIESKVARYLKTGQRH